MLSQQFVLNHCKNYFQDRINNHYGITNSGWGRYDADGPAHRCALGSIVQGKCASVKESVERLIGQGSFESWPKDGFLKLIVRFNDHHCYKGNPLTVEEVNFFLSSLAGKYNLTYENLKIKAKPCRYRSTESLL